MKIYIAPVSLECADGVLLSELRTSFLDQISALSPMAEQPSDCDTFLSAVLPDCVYVRDLGESEIKKIQDELSDGSIVVLPAKITSATQQSVYAILHYINDVAEQKRVTYSITDGRIDSSEFPAVLC